ncbi:MAG: Ig-like domain-containing protein, partial [Tumebacillaceae bacterium]
GNHDPEVVSSISDQLLTPSVTNTRSYDLAQLFSDQDIGDTLTFTAKSDSEVAAHVSVDSNNMLVLTPGTGNASTTVTVTATDGNGGTATYKFTVRTAQLVPNGFIPVNTKQGINGITYDLSDLFPGQTSFTTYMGTPDSTFTGPTPLNGKTLTLDGTDGMYVWVLGADGKAAVFQLIRKAQGTPTMYFSQYLDGGDGRIAFQLDYKGNGTPGDKATGYTVEAYRWMKKTNTMDVKSIPLTYDIWPNVPYVFINAIFYDYFDVSTATYYNNDDLFLYSPNDFNTVALVLKKNNQIVDVIGDPTSHNQFLPNGGTFLRKSGIYTGSTSFSLAGEWDIYPSGSFQFIDHYRP